MFFLIILRVNDLKDINFSHFEHFGTYMFALTGLASNFIFFVPFGTSLIFPSETNEFCYMAIISADVSIVCQCGIAICLMWTCTMNLHIYPLFYEITWGIYVNMHADLSIWIVPHKYFVLQTARSDPNEIKIIVFKN